MELYSGYLFHNRYKLILALGSGASADVWKAEDTKANNLLVGLKIFSQHSEMDSYGLQNFEREFTTVYNIRHSNLLPPTGYDICEGRPYLVMQYCENGSCSSMIGRMEEEDIIKFLHDVAAGLEHLHDNNIIHQDIKPDNILLDDNCNFMVTDFGISVNADNGVYDSNGMSGGTRAYMGPERFEGITNNASDMWSLGATAVEMLLGEPPFGEHGGLLQAEGEALPDLPPLQPEVKDMILRCLEKDPAKRIKANEIRQKIELYWETGSWVKHSRKRLIVMMATAVISVLMCIGIFLWDFNRTKVYYYKDYVERWGIPEGVGRVSLNTMKHRQMTYRFECKQWKVQHLSLVNSAGKIITHTDTEHQNSRFSDVYYFYTEKGKIDYKTIYDQNGRMLFKMDYDENLKTVTFRQNDEFGTEMNLDANTNVLYKSGSSAFDEKSHISRYLLAYDDDGLLVERKYVGLQNVLACDKDNIYGQRYKYDEKGRKVREEFIGSDGGLMSNNDGLAVKVYSYNKNDDWTSVSYLDAEGNGAHDGSNCYQVKLEYDEYGNRIKELYYAFDGSPSIRTDQNVSGFRYTYNKNGFCVLQTCLGLDEEPVYCNAGYVSVLDSCNEYGFTVHRTFLDENNQSILYNRDGDCYSMVAFVPNETGLPLDISYFDENGNRMESANGVFRYRSTFDKMGNMIRQQVFDKDDNPTAVDGFYHERVMEYDEFSHIIREYYLDDKGNVVTSDGTIADYRMEYNRQGAMTKISFRDIKGNLVAGTNLFAGYTIEYDEIGNQKIIQYFNADEKPCMIGDGYSKVEYVYNLQNNFLEEVKNYDVNGGLVFDIHYKYDSKGNIIESYTLVDGKLKQGTVVEKREYDVNNRETTRWSCDLDGKKINYPQSSYSQIKFEYDLRGNCIVFSYWSVDGKPAIDGQKTHKRICEYDAMNRIVCERNLAADGKPLIGTDVNPEGRVKYDQWGNMIEISAYDGYGQPRLTSDGFFIRKSEYDRRGNIVHEEFVGTNGELLCSKSNGYAKADYLYDIHGNKLEGKYFDESKCIRIETWKYNKRNRFIEQRVCDGDGNLSDKFYGVARLTVEYDETGIVPQTQRYYNQSGTLLGSQTWNERTGEWNDIKMTGQTSVNMSSSSWQDAIRRDIHNCPIKLADGIYVQNMRYTNSSVTVIIKLNEVSKYDAGDFLNNLKTNGESLKNEFRKAWKVPNNVLLKLVFIDKAERDLYTL